MKRDLRTQNENNCGKEAKNAVRSEVASSKERKLCIQGSFSFVYATKQSTVTKVSIIGLYIVIFAIIWLISKYL